MKYTSLFPLTAIALTAIALLPGSSGAQPNPPREISGIQHMSSAGESIVIKWPLKKLKGEVNLLVNPDGTYLFSGNIDDTRPKRDLVIALALKSDFGGAVVFHYSGSMKNHVEWSKQGQSPILKDNYKSFAAKADWAGEWRLPLDSTAEAAKYEEAEKNLDRLKQDEADARKRHDQKEAQAKKAERTKLEHEQIAEIQRVMRQNQRQVSQAVQVAQQQQAAQQQAAQQQSGGGGSSFGSDISSAVSTIGSVVSTVSGIGNAIAGLF